MGALLRRGVTASLRGPACGQSGQTNVVAVFTMAQIDELHDRWGRAESLGEYFRGLAGIGVVRFESFVADGHSEYFGADGHSVVSPPHHEILVVAEVSDRPSFLNHLRRHVAGETSYLEMTAGLASSGIAKWVVDTVALTFTYRDRAGTAVLVEHAT